MSFFPDRFMGREIPTHNIPKKIPKKNNIIKYLKNRPLPVFSDKNYNDGFKKGYEHAIELLKKQ
jgi:hypothetical protein